jgi:dUTP pyrophosphatase
MSQEDAMRAMPLVLHVKFKRVHGHAGSPVQAYRGDAGWDLESCEEVTMLRGERARIRTGICAAIPDGYWGLILPRSSTWRNKNIHIEPAVIDAGYRGPIAAYGTYLGPDEHVTIEVGTKLIQIIIIPLPNVEWLEQMDLPPGDRGDNGYGSSGA